ncbi:putative eukaryotic release factor 3 [Leishmania braziliensis MHOM/BR/75/M2904]|uniref:Eukaryotic release factor 3 n=2 Tax=Leishmania braziliensis TaxID=5660 RepID=A4H6P3_LEIBR|nr:putative eukaryotic release factor 3 [Leishmania braziliensis MHOM/BR/75/M2904]CAJ2468084.1 unnamed protein product [Leishmania braziliensis]CAM41997.2 putative eukaryotic release factor 3 [Leishmania braziliensis MHOM/BR/75/M2904]SYZ63669.1 eukaryotic_release_factor_3 [Leishmania braziliensis MHOM/BR/75/M2904]
MSWQQPTGSINPNAPSYAPDGSAYIGNYNAQGAGGYYPPPPPQQQQQQRPAAPNPAPKTSASDAAKLSLGGGSAQPVVAPKKGGGTLSLGKRRPVTTAATASEDTAPQSSAPAVASPVSPSMATEAEPESGAGPSATSAAESPAPEKESAAVTQTERAPKPASAAPAKEAPATTEKDRAKMTPEERRESVKKEIARQRQQSRKEYKRDPRPHFNIVFCGHVDAGKSTISGHLLMEKGLVDQREMEKLRREAEINHREGWEYAYVMDVSEEERSKGITRETGAAYFETERRRVTVLDAPGHKAFVPSMIGGATQADVCVLVISSRTGEFETGFEKGGQTREHAMLVRTCGVKQMICVINKMDEMKWSKERYDEIVGKLKPFLRQNGYDEERAKNLIFMPVAGLTGENLIKHVELSHCDWYKGETMMGVIDSLKLPESKTDDDVLCIPLVGAYKDDGKTHIYGKVESGSIAVGEKIQVLPTKVEALVEGISIESTEFEKCYPGDNVHLHVRGIDESDIHGGYVATSIPTSLRAVEFFQARVVILEVKNIISAGSRVMLHIHSAQEEASFHKLLAKIDRKTNEVVERDPACVKAGDVVIARIELDRPVVLEPHKDFDKLGRFMLRDDGRTIAIGVVTRLYESTHESLAKAGQ